MNKEYIFQPNFEKNKKNKKVLDRKNFDERLKNSEKQRKNNEIRKKEEEEKEFKEKFPFAPKRHNSFNKSFTKNKNDENLYQSTSKFSKKT